VGRESRGSPGPERARICFILESWEEENLQQPASEEPWRGETGSLSLTDFIPGVATTPS
jgi:hypothetical protein